MVINDAKDLKFGDAQVTRAYLGEEIVWPKDLARKYVNVTPRVLWIDDEYDIQIVDVESNTRWSVK